MDEVNFEEGDERYLNEDHYLLLMCLLLKHLNQQKKQLKIDR